MRRNRYAQTPNSSPRQQQPARKTHIFIASADIGRCDHGARRMSRAVELARRYFDLANAGNLAEIRKLFTASSTYSSANTGVYLGADQITEMQAAFFAGFETLVWDIHRVEEIRPGIVLFDFTFSGKTRDGQSVRRPGLEYVVVYEGKLQHVDVRNKDQSDRPVE